MTQTLATSRSTWPTRPPRLVATDLDGTLLDPGGVVSPRTSAALRDAEDAGIEVVFVTARPPRWLAPLAPHVAGHGVAICANGAAVVEVATGRVLAERGMTAQLVTELAAALRSTLGEVHLAVERAEGFAAERGYRDVHVVPPDSPVADRIEDVLTDSTLKLLVRTGTDHGDRHSAAVQAAIGTSALAVDSGAVGLGEISALDVTKARALARWAQERGVPAEDVWACGDAPNDLPMLAWAGESFAVANAYDDVRAHARHACPANGDDGVAAVLEHATALARRA
ncbi:HAD-IIB family hydrolase [Cellulomonas persica]|uniref:Hydrolase n=1 Tax=Cellulomonas persica TaxID=76861 RepID=A0A510UXU2_9CELL|nr:HAD-IIB family hydrolase [Cellulomonas persica]GEK17900.1 hydrolase [Cellulomonas persica]